MGILSKTRFTIGKAYYDFRNRHSKSIVDPNLISPKGMVLEGREAEKTIEGWEEKIYKIEQQQERIKNTIPQMEERKDDLEDKIKSTSFEVAEAKKRFTEVKTPVAKERWARKLVLSNRLLEYQRESQNLMKLNILRAEASIEDALMIGRLLEEKITDAKIYFELNGQIRLIGNALAAAENVYDRTKSAEKDMEISMEGLEEITARLKGTDLVKEAEKLIGKQ